jgi:hypothetical protein
MGLSFRLDEPEIPLRDKMGVNVDGEGRVARAPCRERGAPLCIPDRSSFH